MWASKMKDRTKINFVVENSIKQKAEKILEEEWSKTISEFLRGCLFQKVDDYEKKNGKINLSQTYLV
jgi:hypothetical protein